jgi:hypothetical protein
MKTNMILVISDPFSSLLSTDPDEIDESRRSAVPRLSRAHLDSLQRGQLVLSNSSEQFF